MKTKLRECEHSNYEVLASASFSQGSFSGAKSVRVVVVFLTKDYQMFLVKDGENFALPQLQMEFGLAFPEIVRELEGHYFQVPFYNPRFPSRKMPKICGQYRDKEGQDTVVLMSKIDFKNRSNIEAVNLEHLINTLSPFEYDLVTEVLASELARQELQVA